jgi:hypothetical protein
LIVIVGRKIELHLSFGPADGRRRAPSEDLSSGLPLRWRRPPAPMMQDGR